MERRVIVLSGGSRRGGDICSCVIECFFEDVFGDIILFFFVFSRKFFFESWIVLFGF